MKRGKVNKNREEEEDKNNLPGYPVYPSDEDIYSKGKEERELDPEDITGRKETPKTGKLMEKYLGLDESGSDLDIPGSELDDDLENIGSEDEENNYYSLGDESLEKPEDINQL
jgi:hypothetical protein